MVLAVAAILGSLAWAQLAWWATPEKAPGFSLESTGYENGVMGEPVQFTLDDYRGKTVVLDFMAVACVTCRIVTEEALKPLEASHGNSSDVAILSIDVWAGFAGESREELIALQQRENTTWRHALDQSGLLQAYGAPGIPYVAVVDPDGRLVYAKGGLEHKGLQAAVDAAARGEGQPQAILQVGIVTLAFAAGVATIFTPCAVGLLPGYAGKLIGAQPEQRIRGAVRLALMAGLGLTTLYILLTGALLAFGPALRSFVESAVPFVAVAFVGIGLAMIAGMDWGRWLPRRQGSPQGFYSFGFAYGLASFGCTGPVFLPILAAAFLQGAATGALALMAYVGALVSLLLGVALAVATGKAIGPLQRFTAKARAVQVASGVLMLVAGAYMVWIYGRAGLIWMV